MIIRLLRNVRRRTQVRIAMLVKTLVQMAKEEEQGAKNQALLRRAKACGKGVRLNGTMVITGIEECELGNNVHIGNNAFIRAQGGLKIGDNTHISRNLVLYTTNHKYEGERLPYDEEIVKKPVTIGRNVWIGMNVCIVAGTFIGDGAIVGMGSVVSGEVPRLSIIGADKWRILGWRDETHYDHCEMSNAYGGPNGIPFRLENLENE